MAYREILERQMEYERFLIRQFRERLEQNVKARERYLGACKPFDYASVSGCLPKAYRDAEIPWEDADLWKKNAPRFTQSENP